MNLQGHAYYIAQDATGHFGVLTADNEVIVPFQYIKVCEIESSYFCGTGKNTCHLYNAQAQHVWTASGTSHLTNSNNAIYSYKDISSFFDKTTQKVVKIRLPKNDTNYAIDDISMSFDFFLLYKRDKLEKSKVGLCNRKGKPLLPAIYDNINVTEAEKYIKATLNEQYYYFNYRGKRLKKVPSL